MKIFVRQGREQDWLLQDRWLRAEPANEPLTGVNLFLEAHVELIQHDHSDRCLADAGEVCRGVDDERLTPWSGGNRCVLGGCFKRANGLRLPIFRNAEIVLRQVCDGMSLVVCDGDVQQDKVCCHTKGMSLWRGRCYLRQGNAAGAAEQDAKCVANKARCLAVARGRSR